MSTSSLLDLENQICFAVYSASLTITKAYQPLLKALELTYPQYLVMLVLWQTDGRSVSEIGQNLFLDSGTLTPMLKRMESLGLIERRRSTEDERQVNVHLTPKGRSLRKRAATVPEDLLCASGCSVSELKSLNTSLRKIRENLAKSELLDRQTSKGTQPKGKKT